MITQQLQQLLKTCYEGLTAKELRDHAVLLCQVRHFLFDNSLQDDYPTLTIASVDAQADRLFAAVLMAYTTACSDLDRSVLLQAHQHIVFGLKPLADPKKAMHHRKLAGTYLRGYMKSHPLAAPADTQADAETMLLMSGYLHLNGQPDFEGGRYVGVEGQYYETQLLRWLEPLTRAGRCSVEGAWPAADDATRSIRLQLLADYADELHPEWQPLLTSQQQSLPGREPYTLAERFHDTKLATLSHALTAEEQKIHSTLFL